MRRRSVSSYRGIGESGGAVAAACFAERFAGVRVRVAMAAIVAAPRVAFIVSRRELTRIIAVEGACSWPRSNVSMQRSSGVEIRPRASFQKVLTLFE
jgi:hypothetical protein